MARVHKKSGRTTRILFIGVAYIIKVYQAKLDAFIKTGRAEIALMCPIRWKFREWSRTFTLQVYYPGIHLYPAKVRLFNGWAGAYLYPVLMFLHALYDFKPDLIYVEQEVFSLSAFEAAIFARLFKIPLVVFCWENTDRRLSIIRRWTRSFVLRTAKLITPGNRGAADLLRIWGYTGSLDIIPQLGVDTSLFSSSLYLKPDGPFSIGFTGRLVYEKGVDIILAAARKLANHGRVFQVVICGVGPYENVLRKQVETLGMSDRVKWLGEYEYEDIPRAIVQMDVLVLPSRTLPGQWKEQFGHVLIEAMSMGLPVVGSRSGAIPDVIGRGDLVFAEEDANGLADILERLMMDRQYRDEVVRFGLARINEMYTNEAVAWQLLMLFEPLLADGKGL